MTDRAGATQRGIVLLDLGRPAEAERLFREALAADPGNADTLVHLARALHRQERYTEAQDTAQQALAASPEHVNGLLVLSASLAGLKDFEGALTVLRQGTRLAPMLASLHRQEGALLIAQGKSAEALAPLERARGLEPQDAETVALVGAALYNVRRFPEAEQAIADALSLNPDSAEAHRIRGLLSLRRGGGATAVDAHRTALRLDPSDPGYRQGLAMAMKSRNPLYGLLLRFGHWVDGLPTGARWGILLSPYIATRLLRPYQSEVWAQVLICVVVAIVVLLWTLEPVMNTVLLGSGAYARNLLAREAKIATAAFLVYVVAALIAVVASFSTDNDRAGGLAIGFVLWAVTAGQVHLVAASRRRLAFRLQAAGAALAVAAAATVAIGVSVATLLVGVFIVAGIAMIWFTSFA